MLRAEGCEEHAGWLTLDAARRLAADSNVEEDCGVGSISGFLQRLLLALYRASRVEVDLHDQHHDHRKELHGLLHGGMCKPRSVITPETCLLKPFCEVHRRSLCQN